MKVYLVGGAVRDELLGLSPQEKDYVVVGATVQEMLDKGFRQVGKDFPVFLHPETNEEYALARTERKIGRGYTGFAFDTSLMVTLEEDLKRRDLTINAMAKTVDGVVIDPYHGKDDLEKKLLRHVSPAFVEDPVRILRVGRFAARYADLGFAVAQETWDLMRQMVVSGEVNSLVSERVWKELERALQEKHPEKFFYVLNECGALIILFPAIDFAGPGIQALVRAVNISLDPQVRFAALLHPLLEKQIKALADRYRVPNEYRDLALLTARYLSLYRKVERLTADEILQLLQSIDAFRRPERFQKFLRAAEAAVGNSCSAWLMKCFDAAKTVNVKELIDAGYANFELAIKINERRRDEIGKIISSQW